MHAGERGQRIGVGNLAFVDQLVQRAFQAFAGALRSAFATIKQRDANARLAEQALHAMGSLYEIERQARDMSDEERWRIRQEKASPILDTLHDWMLAQRDLVPNGSATAKALDYSLKRWVALTRYLEDGTVPIDNNQVENQIRPWALGRSNWLFAGSLRSGKRAAAIMSLIQSARMNGHDPYAYLKDVLTRLPTQRASEVGQLLPHQWAPA